MTNRPRKETARKTGATSPKASRKAADATKGVERSATTGKSPALKHTKGRRSTSSKRAAAATAAQTRTGSRRQGATSPRRQRGGATSKRTISFDTTVLRAAEALAGSAAGGNLSAVVNDAVAHHVRLLEFGMLLAEFEKELGPVSAQVRAEVEAEWQD